MKFDHTKKCYTHNPASALENDTHKPQWDYDIQTDYLISARLPVLIVMNKKKKKKEIAKLWTLFSRLTTEYNWKKVKRRISTSTLLRNWKKLWNRKVTIIPIMIGAFGTVTKRLLKGLVNLEVGERVETIQNTALLWTARILRRVLDTWGDLLSIKLLWKTISLRR